MASCSASMGEEGRTCMREQRWPPPLLLEVAARQCASDADASSSALVVALQEEGRWDPRCSWPMHVGTNWNSSSTCTRLAIGGAPSASLLTQGVGSERPACLQPAWFLRPTQLPSWQERQAGEHRHKLGGDTDHTRARCNCGAFLSSNPSSEGSRTTAGRSMGHSLSHRCKGHSSRGLGSTAWRRGWRRGGQARIDISQLQS